MQNAQKITTREKWALFRFSVIARLIAFPPEKGELKEEILRLSQTEWNHPVSGKSVKIAFSTIESWYYRALEADKNPVKMLERKTRSDVGNRRTINDNLRAAIIELHKDNPNWTHKLHYDNLVVLVRKDLNLGEMPSYSTIRRFRQQMGFEKVHQKKYSAWKKSSVDSTVWRKHEIRRFENPFVNGLWHCDCHHCSRKLLSPSGEWVKPKLMAIIDDHSRLVCHLQWYWDETAENLVHTMMQAFLKFGLPRAFLSDNGGPMTADETKGGLKRLGIVHETTLPRSPYQNGKQEVFFGMVEGRLLPMLQNVREIDLEKLNRVTQAWLEHDYNSCRHSEIGESPKKRFRDGEYRGRNSPDMEELEKFFCIEETRKIRKTDNTITLKKKRFEIPNHWRHLQVARVRYASWDLSKVWLVNGFENDVLDRLWPVDVHANADGRRRELPLVQTESKKEKPDKMAPLLQEQLDNYESLGLPPAYMPKDKKGGGEENA